MRGRGSNPTSDSGQSLTRYTEAVKKVTGDAQIPRQNGTKQKEIHTCNGCDQLKEETLIVNKKYFVLLMAEIVNCLEIP